MFVLTRWLSLSRGTWSLTPWCDRQQLDSTRTTAKTAAYSCVATEDKHWLISNHKAGAPWTFEIFIDVSLLPEMLVCHDLTSSLNWASRRGLAAAYNVGLRIKNLLGFEIYNIYSWIHSCLGWLGNHRTWGGDRWHFGSVAAHSLLQKCWSWKGLLEIWSKPHAKAGSHRTGHTGTHPGGTFCHCF